MVDLGIGEFFRRLTHRPQQAKPDKPGPKIVVTDRQSLRTDSRLPRENIRDSIKIVRTVELANKETPVELSEKVFGELTEITRRNPENEILSVVMKKDGKQKVVLVMNKEDGGVILDSTQERLDKERKDGWTPIACHHNHPVSTVNTYSTHGYPPNHATSPSNSDMRHPYPEWLQPYMGLQFPRIISALDPQTNTVMWHCFRVAQSQEKASVGVQSYEFVDETSPIRVTSSVPGVVIAQNQPIFTRPDILYQQGIIAPVPLHILGKQSQTPTILKNPFTA